ncbi:UNVERIFIED_CONTAM: hypothetical protein Sradi_3184800 [Sesamum radiatum]|uniref:Uncharacterized protein n=1 Tax=Sesamum radiatum TaxID=300843 RepID=A0AAW2RFM0_SESRA
MGEGRGTATVRRRKGRPATRRGRDAEEKGRERGDDNGDDGFEKGEAEGKGRRSRRKGEGAMAVRAIEGKRGRRWVWRLCVVAVDCGEWEEGGDVEAARGRGWAAAGFGGGWWLAAGFGVGVAAWGWLVLGGGWVGQQWESFAG